MNYELFYEQFLLAMMWGVWIGLWAGITLTVMLSLITWVQGRADRQRSEKIQAAVVRAYDEQQSKQGSSLGGQRGS
jgi:hypothetical protein